MSGLVQLTAAQVRIQERICDRGYSLHRAIVTAGLRYPGDMPQSVFLALQAIAEGQELAVAMGQDTDPNFAADVDAVARLLESSQWSLHPDHGCVLTADIDQLETRPCP